jgi:tetratricopeptide (TPR) repeat protein
MKIFIHISMMFLVGCSSTMPDEHVRKMNKLAVELEHTKNIADRAITKVEDLERELSRSIIQRDSLLFEHKQETVLLRASDAFHKGNNALLTKKYNKAIFYFNKTIQMRPNDAHAYNNLGNAYKENENYNKAIDCYNTAIKIKPDYASAYYNLGIVYQRNDNFDTALDSYKKAARLAHNGVRKWLKDGGHHW